VIPTEINNLVSTIPNPRGHLVCPNALGLGLAIVPKQLVVSFYGLF
jgi:hypothetical protein